MRTIVKLIVGVLFILASQHSKAQTSFYNELSPYGTWIEYPGYGLVWHPEAEAGFRPYATNGFWQYTDAGWFWNSGYDWGWIAFHYGSWLYDDNLGWLWVPGDDWAPAWVIWGNTDDYYAWAPLEPGVRYTDDWRPHDFYWNMVERKHISDRDLSGSLLNADRIREKADRIAIIPNFQQNETNHTFFSKGPDIKEAQSFANQTIEPVSIKDVRRISDNQRIDAAPVSQPPTEMPNSNQFRKASTDDIRSIRSIDNNQWPSMHNEPQMNYERQMNNVRSMPVMHFESGGMSMPSMREGGGGGHRGR